MMRSLCVFCGSRFGAAERYHSQAARLGELCGQNGVDVVYGGGHVGLMGVVADAAMAADGKVIGFIPERLLDWEVGHHGISELVVTDNMSDRKDKMVARSDAFAILPGGLGTLDELFEVLTLRQLGYHEKPIILINIDGFWDPLTGLIRQTVEHGFAGADIYPMMQTVDGVEDVLPALGLEAAQPDGTLTSCEKTVS